MHCTVSLYGRVLFHSPTMKIHAYSEISGSDWKCQHLLPWFAILPSLCPLYSSSETLSHLNGTFPRKPCFCASHSTNQETFCGSRCGSTGLSLHWGICSEEQKLPALVLTGSWRVEQKLAWDQTLAAQMCEASNPNKVPQIEQLKPQKLVSWFWRFCLNSKHQQGDVPWKT